MRLLNIPPHLNCVATLPHKRLQPVDGVGVVFIKVADSGLKLRTALRLVDGQTVEVRVGVEGELVHWINRSHVIQHEEQYCCSLGTGTVALQRVVTQTDIFIHYKRRTHGTQKIE